MRALREHPRVTIVKSIGAVVLVAIGAFIDASDRSQTQALEIRVTSARDSLSARSAELRDARARARHAEMAAARAWDDLTATKRANRRLRRELAQTRRARRRSNRRQ
jgi:hypothetical protein